MPPELQTETPTETTPHLLDAEAKPESNGKRVIKRSTEAKGDAPRDPGPAKIEPSQTTPEMRETLRQSDKAIRDIIDGFGGGGFKIRLSRKDPDEWQDPATGKYIHVGGFLKEIDTEIDEEWIQRRYGGGKYELEFKKPGPKGGWVYGGMTTIVIAGEPNLSELPKASRAQQPGAQVAAPATEAPSVVSQALTFMGKAVERAEDRAAQAHSHKSGPDDAVIQMMQRQLEASEKRNDALMREIREAQNKPAQKTAEESVTTRMLDKLIDGDSARITALRAQYDSEIRALNEARREDEKRMYDRFERDLAALRQTHERELSSLRSSQEVALSAVRSGAQVEVSAAKASFDTQMAIAKSENEKLRADNAELRAEVKELRAKKEKGPIELIKEMKVLKEAFGEDDEEETGVGAKILEAVANPSTWEGIGAMIGKAKGDQQAAMARPEVRRDRVISVRGRKMIAKADGSIVPAKPKAPVAAEGTEEAKGPTMPEVDPDRVALIVSFLERAFEGQQDAKVVAQGARSHVPEDMITAIRDHGVDQVMAKMAKLSSTSPLSSQRGRGWLRELGEALVG